ncbi:hypothetical protein BN1708_001331 [Verticillium longisporum]|uniref:Rhodopsin domain-containing protein n=1 Tax=Verticillium longisporum TaxID=100787 RepID=A0A0G4MNB9_VERLO|nr:hypothetical protein BN1708_001331 [Verticillium longisporum]
MAGVDLTEDQGGALVATAITFLVLSWVSVILRTYVRAILTKAYQADDWLMLVAQLIFTASCVFILAGVDNGLGMHNKALEQSREIRALMYQALATATYVLNMMFIKFSVGIFLLRLTTSKGYIWTIYISLAIVMIWTLVIFFWNIFQCHPVQAQWDYTIQDATCVTPDHIVSAAYSISVMTILSDWLYALMPIPMIWKVKMTVPAKISVILLLSLGIFASVATLIRLKFLADLNDLDDILFAGTDAMVWTLVEPGVAIVAASLVTIRPLLRLFRLHGFESTGRTPGPSGTARSGTQRSFGKMPAYGHGELTAIDIELAEAKSSGSYATLSIKSNPPPLHMSPLNMSPFDPAAPGVLLWPPPFEHRRKKSKSLDVHESLQDDGSQPARRSYINSQMYVIEGPGAGGVDKWTGDRLRSPSVSSDDLDGVDAQSQQSGRLGLSGRR